MANLPVPVPASEQAGNLITGALWNANVYNGLSYLLSPPAFSGYQSSAQTFTNNAQTALLLDSEALDSYNGHSTTSNTSRYVAQVTGYYFVFGTITWVTNTTGVRVCFLAKNGTAVNGAYGGLANTTFNATAMTAGVVQLNSGDYVETWGIQNSGGGLATQTPSQCSAMTLWFMHA